MSTFFKSDRVSFQSKETYKFLVKVNSSKEFPIEVRQRFLNTLIHELSDLESGGRDEENMGVELTVKQVSSDLDIFLTTSRSWGSRYVERVAKNCLVKSMGRKLNSGMHDYFVDIKVLPELRAGC
jgi:hypothetical protein